MLDALRIILLPSSLLSAAVITMLLSGAQGFVRCIGCSTHVLPNEDRPRALLRPTYGALDFGDRVRARGNRQGGRAGALRMMNATDKKAKGPYKVIANNKKARRNYEIMEKFDAGIELVGSEVKSCRLSKINMDDGFAQAKNGQCFLHGVHIAECGASNRFYQHEPKRPRRLLLHKREIKKLQDKIAQKGMTVVPLKIYFNDDNRLKVEIGLAQGKNVRDKRDDIKDRDAKRDLQRLTKNAY